MSWYQSRSSESRLSMAASRRSKYALSPRRVACSEKKALSDSASVISIPARAVSGRRRVSRNSRSTRE